MISKSSLLKFASRSYCYQVSHI